MAKKTQLHSYISSFFFAMEDVTHLLWKAGGWFPVMPSLCLCNLTRLSSFFTAGFLVFVARDRPSEDEQAFFFSM